ncbi:MFS transporter [Sphingopyxis sp. RIFCSPHIGHO2_12_FULL_65_19]|uniref:MFS transporter n=1 Tax=Sphingopyxis sp. RIFCSPHIGHO2_12_FULL_65_19 TaxID=1802172 RepID=UPI0008CD3714|nr:MFS transporter [Sphingopyxis sp. RIFCSPHIGHO2_12_FULL_65_19]OHD10132.1 MAG: arabinose ABC transporter permease [Sphingopyxis sp. RIFCSPHIGHO2_12_FULL_65_19]
MSPDPPAPPSALAPFRYPAFRAIWIANLASNMGSMIQSVAAAWLMTELTNSHLLIALVQAGATIPILLLGIFAGAIADNFDRRRVMLAAQTGMLLVSAALTLTTWLDAITPLSLLFFTLAVGCGTALNGPAWQASVRLQVGPRDLPQAIALNTIAYNLARSVGPALGGLLISIVGTAAAFGLNAISYIVLIIVLLRWHPETTPRRRTSMLTAIAAGIRFCAQSDPVRRVLTRGFAFGFGAAGFQALLPSLVRDRLHGTEIIYGLCLAAFGAGSIFGALCVGAARHRWGSDRVVTGASLIFAAAMLPVALTASLASLIVAAFVAGAAWVSMLTTLNVAMQLRSPEEILGRCLSIYQAVTFGAMALGAYALGLIADLSSLPTAIIVSIVWLVLTALILRFVAPMPRRDEGRLLP